jgi:pyrroline-5-carboxylate reductase
MTGNLAIIGGGNMGEALLSGLLRGDEPSHRPKQLVVVERVRQRAEYLHETYGVAVVDPATATRHADTVILTVKPYHAEAVLAELDNGITTEHLVVSAIGGIRATQVESRLTAAAPVVRTMPNTAVALGQGMITITAGDNAGNEHLDRAESLLTPLGRVMRVTEDQLDAVTALSGSGPAYFFLLAEAMIDAGVLLGLSRPMAEELVKHTAAGAGAMLRDSGDDAVQLRAAVSSPGGTTIAAIQEFENRALRAATMAAALAARDRSIAQGKHEAAK